MKYGSMDVFQKVQMTCHKPVLRFQEEMGRYTDNRHMLLGNSATYLPKHSKYFLNTGMVTRYLEEPYFCSKSRGGKGVKGKTAEKHLK